MNFDQIIQTKSSKITLEEFQNYVKKSCVDRNELQTFLNKAKKEQIEQSENFKL
tara:strand:- start:645 stop:806 length:162 start_codon:yes stop_codon:yes gene_type:complete